MTRVDCIKCECGCGDYVSPNTYRKHLRQPRSARRRWRSKAAASPTFEESLATQAPPATSVNATQAPAPALLPFQAVCEEPRESRAFVEEVSVSTSSLTTTTLRSIRVHSASKHSLDDAEDVTPASDADAEDDAEDQIPSRTPRRRSARLRQRVCPPPPVVQEQLRRIQTPPSPADEETPHDELFDDFSFFLEGDAPSLPDSPPHLPAIDQQLSPADALALLVMILQRKNGITREAIEQFYLLLNTAVLHPDDPSTQSILFQTARKRVLQLFNLNTLQYRQDVQCSECGTLYPANSAWELSRTCRVGGVDVPTCSYLLPGRTIACGTSLFECTEIDASQVAGYKQRVSLPSRIVSVESPSEPSVVNHYSVRPVQFGCMLKYQDFLTAWCAQHTKSELIQLLRTHHQDARAAATAAGVIRDVWDGKMWKTIMDPATLLHPEEDALTVALSLSYDGIALFAKRPRASEETKKKKLGAGHLVMLNLPNNIRSQRANVCCAWLMENEPSYTLNGFTQLVVEELIALGNDGLSVRTRDGQTMHIYTRLCMITADSPAKSKVVGLSHHSACHGCPKCTLAAIDKSWRDACLEEFETVLSHLRTMSSTLANARHVLGATSKTDLSERIRASEGVRPTPFMDKRLRDMHFDVVQHTAIDVMHNVCLGVGVKLLDCLIADKNDAELLDRLEAVNNCLPTGASHLRLPKSFFQNCSKASHMLIFIMTHSEVVLYKYAPVSSQRYHLWQRFVHCCRTFFACELTAELIDDAEQTYHSFLQAFMEEFPTLSIPFNMHTAIHICENLRVHGPSFTSWCFAYERLMGRLSALNYSRSCHGLLTTVINALSSDIVIELASVKAVDQGCLLPSSAFYVDVLERLTGSRPEAPCDYVYRIEKIVRPCNQAPFYVPEDNRNCSVTGLGQQVNQFQCTLAELREASFEWAPILCEMLSFLQTEESFFKDLQRVQLVVRASTRAEVSSAKFRAEDCIAGLFLNAEGQQYLHYGVVQTFLSVNFITGEDDRENLQLASGADESGV